MAFALPVYYTVTMKKAVFQNNLILIKLKHEFWIWSICLKLSKIVNKNILLHSYTSYLCWLTNFYHFYFSSSLSAFHFTHICTSTSTYIHTLSLTINCYLNYNFVHFRLLNNKSVRIFDHAIDLLKWVLQTFIAWLCMHVCMLACISESFII